MNDMGEKMDFHTCGLGLVQDLTLTMTPPPQEALQGVLTVDQGLWKRKCND